MRRSETRLRGLGEQVIKILACELRDIADLPDEVQIVDVIRPPSQSAGEFYPDFAFDQWPHIVADEKYVYVHIRSRYAVRRPARSPLMVEDFESFLRRWDDLWKDKK